MRGAAFHYDDTNMHHAAVGAAGITADAWDALLPALEAAKQEVIRLTTTGEQGFASLPFERSAAQESARMAHLMGRRFTDLVVLGIGGSDLGARMLHQALVDPAKRKKGEMRVHFAGSSTDPDTLYRLLKSLNLNHTCVNVVSKSGGTLEPMAAFLLFRDRLIHEVGSRNMARHIVATTDASTGVLRSLTEQEGYESLTIPTNVGGRFSVLSSVGLFPAAAAGINIKGLLAGGRDLVGHFRHTPTADNLVSRYAGLHAWGAKNKKTIQVLVPYTPLLAACGKWYSQLVAESLGKAKLKKGKGPVSITPIACLGPEDQHSQLQLWSEGLPDKLITFIEIQAFQNDLRTPSAASLGSALAPLGRQSFTKLVHIGRAATAEALRQDHRPTGTLTLDKLDAPALGRLILFFELAVALMGQLLHVNAYDQPGVERSKQLTKAALTS